MPRKRKATRKIKDKWKAKSWYNIIAPPMFDRVVLGETPADDPSKLYDRVTEVTVQDITGDFSKMHIKLHFKIHDVRGGDAYTHFVGHDMTSDYIRRLTRRKRTRTDAVVDVRTKDGSILRLKPMAITDRRIQSSKEAVIRRIMVNIVRRTASACTVGELVKKIITGELSRDIAVACKPIQPVQRVEIRKSEVIKLSELPTPPEPGEEVEEKVEAAPEEEGEEPPESSEEE